MSLAAERGKAGEKKVSIKLERRDIAIAELVASFVKHEFPEHDIVSIEYQEAGVPEEGFFPDVTICPNWMDDRPKTFEILFLNVWIGGDGEYVRFNGVYYDFNRTPTGAYAYEGTHP